jgi:hypothetical protein
VSGIDGVRVIEASDCSRGVPNPFCEVFIQVELAAGGAKEVHDVCFDNL